MSYDTWLELGLVRFTEDEDESEALDAVLGGKRPAGRHRTKRFLLSNVYVDPSDVATILGFEWSAAEAGAGDDTLFLLTAEDAARAAKAIAAQTMADVVERLGEHHDYDDANELEQLLTALDLTAIDRGSGTQEACGVLIAHILTIRTAAKRGDGVCAIHGRM